MNRTARLLAHLDAHRPATPREAASLRQMRALVRWLPRPFDEDADPTHVTASAIVVDGAGRVVLHRHRRLGLWLQPGGHVDPDEEPERGALREVAEETGLRCTLHDGSPVPLHVDVHEGGRGHLHLDVRYLLFAPPEAALRPSPGESEAVEWMSYDEAAARGDTSLCAALDAARRLLEDEPDRDFTTSRRGAR